MLPKKPYIEDTIVACATAGGIGGINVIRVSGVDAEKIAKKIIGDLPSPRTATYRKFRNKKNEIIDMGLIIFFPSPNSFTGESVVEFHSHGGPLLGETLIDEIVGLLHLISQYFNVLSHDPDINKLYFFAYSIHLTVN